MWNFLVVRCDNQRLGTVILRQEWRFNSRHKIGKVLFNQPHYSGSIDRIGIFIHANDDNDPLGLRRRKRSVINLGEPIIAALSSINRYTSLRLIDEVNEVSENVDRKKWSGRVDLNHRPHAPQACALPCCATPRYLGEVCEN